MSNKEPSACLSLQVINFFNFHYLLNFVFIYAYFYCLIVFNKNNQNQNKILIIVIISILFTFFTSSVLALFLSLTYLHKLFKTFICANFNSVFVLFLV